MFSSTQNSQQQPDVNATNTQNSQPHFDANATLTIPPAAVLTVVASDAASNSASSVTASTLSVSPQSLGGTLKRNVNGKSEVWQFFQIYEERMFTTHAFCILCKSDVNYGRTHSTSNLEKHMQRHHKNEYDTIMCERANKRLKLGKAGDTSTIQQKLTKFMASSTDEYQECLLDWMIESYQPLTAVQKDSFRKLTQSLNKTAPIIGQEKIRSLLSIKYFETQQYITKILKGNNVALTTDSWTSIAKEGFVTCTMHFIEPLTWSLHSFSLGIIKKDGASTANDAVRYAEEHMKKFNVSYPQLTFIVTDTEAMIAAGRLFKEKSTEEGGKTFDHKLELVTKLAFKDTPESISAMAACRGIVNFFNSSSQATEKLKEKSKAMLGAALTVIQDVVTRWWSTFSMCERLLKLRTVLTIMHLEGGMRLFLTEAQWSIVTDMTVVLKPFMIAQRLLEGQSYVTISLIPYMLYKIRNGLRIANVDPLSSPQVQTISARMIEKYNEEFGTGEEYTVTVDRITVGRNRRVKGIPKIVLTAMFLDPRTKTGTGIPVTDREIMWQYIEEELAELAMEIGPHAPHAAQPTATAPPAPDDVRIIENNAILNNNRGLNDVNDFLHELQAKDELQELDDAIDEPINLEDDEEENWSQERVREIIQAEIKLYKAAKGMKLRDPLTRHFGNPLDWWKVNETNFPWLAKLAMKYLSIPATSAPSKRVFSTAGLTIAKDRARLEASRANEIVFLHDSLPALRKYKALISEHNQTVIDV